MDITFIQDFVRGTKIGKTTKFMLLTEKWSEKEIKAYQLEKLRRLLKHCYENVPYYKDVFERYGVTPPVFVTCLEDFQRLPILTKEEVRLHTEEFIPKGMNMNSRKIKKGKTGGTTGMPLKLYKNTATRDFAHGAWRRWYGWMGIKFTDKEAVLWGQPTVLSDAKTFKQWFVNKFSNTLNINSFNLNEDTLPVVAQQIIDFKPRILRGYLSAILQLATYFKANNLSVSSLKAISTTTETLLPTYRKYIEDVFHVKMFDQYGCGECGSIAFECECHEGLHITEEHCLLEIIDEQNLSITDKSGRVIVTDLDNYALPLLRYQIGDSAVMSSKKCSCGRSSHLLQSISGRTKDVIYLKDGSAVNGIFFVDLFHELGYDNFEYFTRFQVYQKIKGDFECRLETTGKSLLKDRMEEIINTLSKFGNKVEVVILLKLENDKSGKFRYLISDISDE